MTQIKELKPQRVEVVGTLILRYLEAIPKKGSRQARNNIGGYLDYIGFRRKEPGAVELVEDDFTGVAIDRRYYQQQIGIFNVVNNKAFFDLIDAESGMFLPTGAPYVDLHIPQSIGSITPSFTNVTSSLRLIAEYIHKHKLNPLYVAGVTDDSLASAAGRWGFSEIPLPLPIEVRGFLAQAHDAAPDQVKTSIGRLQEERLVFQPALEFTRRYGPRYG